MADEIALIAGLGNPGKAYLQHRHNAGFWFIDMLANHYDGEFAARSKLQGNICQVDIGTKLVWLFKPDVFVNESGRALQAISRFYQIDAPKILVVHDEIDFPPAKVRLKYGGGHGGHNGLRDIIRQMGSSFWRLRVGVGHPGTKEQVTPYVLGNATASEYDAIAEALSKAMEVMPSIVQGEFELAMNELHF